jgi:2-dehydrotetronate isomerase
MSLRFSANISMLFTDLPFVARIKAAKEAGFAAVECHFPYDIPKALIKSTLIDAGMVMNGINTPAGDMKAGEFGFAALPSRSDDFKRGFELALTYATELNCESIHCLSGHINPADRQRANDAFQANMHWAAQQIDDDITLLIEPLNHIDRPTYFVSRSDDVVALLRELNHPRVKLLFDIYHIQIMEGDLLRRLERHWPFIGHVQIASVPSRHEPDDGEINIKAIFNALIAKQWQGWIGAEYNPRGTTNQGLNWLAQAQSQ